jgi:hypothetical protein
VTPARSVETPPSGCPPLVAVTCPVSVIVDTTGVDSYRGLRLRRESTLLRR